MDRGIWETPVHGVTRVGHNLATKQQKTLGYCLDNVAFNIMGFLKSHKKQETYLELTVFYSLKYQKFYINGVNFFAAV